MSPATITVTDPLLEGLIADQFPLALSEALPGDTITVILGVLDAATTTTTTVPGPSTTTVPPPTTTTTVAP